jgi:hypothetical protein
MVLNGLELIFLGATMGCLLFVGGHPPPNKKKDLAFKCQKHWLRKKHSRNSLRNIRFAEGIRASESETPDSLYRYAHGNLQFARKYICTARMGISKTKLYIPISLLNNKGIHFNYQTINVRKKWKGNYYKK